MPQKQPDPFVDAMVAPTLVELKAAYARNENITSILREYGRSAVNEQSAILMAYDLQAGSYVQALQNADFREAHGRYSEAIAAVLAPLQPRSLCEPGVGEATTLLEVVSRLALPAEAPILGYDINWSRVHVARRHLQAHNVKARLFVAELEAGPLPNDAVDVVFTSHAVEPNHGREPEVLAELFRIARRYLVLFEPSYEFASPEARARMESHGYCRGLRATAERMHWKIAAHHLLSQSLNPLNPTAVLVIEKGAAPHSAISSAFTCPSCRGALAIFAGAHYCAAEGLAFPTLRDIPCLSRRNGILASRFLD